MGVQPSESGQLRGHPPAVRVLLILVAITVAFSLIYSLLYVLGTPLRLPVVSEISALAVDNVNSTAAVGTADGQVLLWRVPRGIETSLSQDFEVAKEEPWPRWALPGHDGAVLEVAFTPDGASLITIGEDGQVFVWEIATGQKQNQFTAGEGPLSAATASADGTRLAVIQDDGTVLVWNLTGEQVQSFAPGPDDRLTIAINSDGTLIAAGQGTNILIWDADSGTLVREITGYWDDPEEQDTWIGHDEEVTSLAFSWDDQLIASGSADTTINFWDIASGEVEASSEGHWATVSTMTFGEDNRQLLSGGRDNKIRILRLPGGKSTAIFEGHLAAINGVEFGLQADTILTASSDGTLRLWETANQKIVHIEWSKLGLQPTWGRTLIIWLAVSGIIGLVILWGLWKVRIWSHLLALGLYLLGPIITIGLPLLEVLSYPLHLGDQLRIAWPLIFLGGWYIVLLYVLMREKVALYYETPKDAPLSEQLQVSLGTQRTRFGIFTAAVWIGLLVILFSVLRRFNLDVAFMGHYLGFIMAGSGLTILVSALSILLAMVLALLGALGRLSKNPLANGISGFYISLIRGTPLLVQIFIWYLGLPRLGVILPALWAGILALGVNYGAYMTEIFRAGIQAISKGQYEAAEALGMSGGQVFRRIVLPQAFRIVIPPIGNQFIAMMKDSSLVSVMSIWELTYRAQKIGRQNFRNLETFIIAAAFYWILTVVFQFLQGKLEEYMARGERR
jgi:polar amino acid transport system permease protein